MTSHALAGPRLIPGRTTALAPRPATCRIPELLQDLSIAVAGTTIAILTVVGVLTLHSTAGDITGAPVRPSAAAQAAPVAPSSAP